MVNVGNSAEVCMNETVVLCVKVELEAGCWINGEVGFALGGRQK